MKKLFIAALATGMSVASFAQTVNLTTFADDGYTQNFDGLQSSGNVNLTVGGGEFGALPGWYYGLNGGTSMAQAQYTLATDDGFSNTGRFNSYGTTASTERALGSASSGPAGTLAYGARFVNATGTSTGLFVVQFDLEQWRNGGNLTAQGLSLSYKLVKGGGGFVQGDFNAGTGFVTTGIKTQTTTTDDAGLLNLSGESAATTIFGPITGASATKLDGNLVANSVRVRTVIQLFANNEVFEPGDEIIFRWHDLNDAGNDHGFGIDNVEAVPEPASMLAIGLGIAGLAARRRRASK